MIVREKTADILSYSLLLQALSNIWQIWHPPTCQLIDAAQNIIGSIPKRKILQMSTFQGQPCLVLKWYKL